MLNKSATLTLLFLTTFLCIAANPFFSQQDTIKAKVVEKLCSKSSKDWVFEGVIQQLGPKCTKGIVYTFRVSGVLEIRECISGAWKRTEKKWSIVEANALDVKISVDGQIYYLLFREHPKNKRAQEMTLRKLTNRLSEPTKDMVFTYEKE